MKILITENQLDRVIVRYINNTMKELQLTATFNDKNGDVIWRDKKNSICMQYVFKHETIYYERNIINPIIKNIKEIFGTDNGLEKINKWWSKTYDLGFKDYVIISFRYND